MQGGRNTINTHRPILLIEGIAKGDRIHQLLQSWDYDVYKFYDNQFYLDEFDCDNNFLVPREKTSSIKPYLAVSQSQALEAAG